MKIGLIDVDSEMSKKQIYNLALMKVSQYHKVMKKNQVEWYNSMFKYDVIYMSKLFDFTPDYPYPLNADKIYKGGTGYDLTTNLIEGIEKSDPDYSIYPQCDYSLQFFSRGCIRSCPFCVVKQKEGDIRPVEPMVLNPNGKHIEILDNNFFANPEWKKAIKQLKLWNQPVNFHGVDVRIMTEEHVYYLNQLKHTKQIHIAWDNPREDLVPKLKEILKQIKAYKLMCYVLIGYWSTKKEDLYRIEKLRELKIDPFVMPYDKSDIYQRNFARWVNHKAIWRTVKWEDYNRR
jgi:hypothetical protein